MAINLLDITSNNNDLTNVNSATEVTTSLPFADSSIAVDLEANSTQYLSAEDSASLSITGDITIELWVKHESLPAASGYMTYVTKYNVSEGYSYAFWLYNDAGTYLLRWTSSDGVANDDVNTPWTPTNGTWYHIAVSFNTSTQVVKFYVNGVQQGVDQGMTTTSIQNTEAKLLIGAFNPDTPVSLFDGVIDDVRLWNDVRTVTEIANNKSVELTGTEANLVAYWPFEEIATGFVPKLFTLI